MMATPSASAHPDPMVLKFLQYTHLEKLYGYLPGMAGAIPGIFGLDREGYDRICAGFDTAARDAAQRLLGDDVVAAQVDALPFRPDQTVLAVGDSQTDDLQSWVEILRHLLDLRRPGHGVRVVNGGLSAHTSAMVLRRWPATLSQYRPDWVICALGGNDVNRTGPEPTKMQVGLAESVANLRELRRIAAARSRCAWVWITPAPVHEERVAQFQPFRFGESSWRNADIRALSEAMLGFEEPVVDLSEVIGIPPDPELQGPDGVHVTIAGQAAIATAVVHALSAGHETAVHETAGVAAVAGSAGGPA